MKFFRQLVLALAVASVIGVLTYTAVSRYVVHKAEENLQSIILSHRSFHHYIQRVMHPAYYKARENGKIADDFYAPEILSSSFVVRVMHGYFNEERKNFNLPPVYYKLASNNPRNILNKADEKEASLIRLFNQRRDLNELTEIATINGQKHLVYAKPFLETNQACLRCHGSRSTAPPGLQQIYSGQGGFNESAGTIRAIESIRIPLNDEYSAAFVATSASLSAAVILTGLWLFNVQLRSRVKSGISALEQEMEERRKAEGMLQFTRASVDVASDAIFWITPDGRFADVNHAACRVLGYSREELLQMSVPDVDPNYTLEDLIQQFPVLRTQKTVRFETSHRTKDGTVFPVEVVANYVSHGDEERNCAFVRDISDRKRSEDERINLEKQLLHAQKLESLGVLAGGIAHDFNNLLTSIVGNTDLALMRLNPESPARDNLQRIEQAATRAADLARQMLAYSGKGKFVIESIDLNRLISEMTHMLEVSISKKALLRFRFADNLPAVDVDATQLRQIIMNLVINASEAIGDRSGIISVSTGCMHCDRSYLSHAWLNENMNEGMYVWLEVADTGCGMDKETVSRIFDPFFTTKFTGRGLGMAAVLGIVRGHKGAIRIYSEPGKGTTFKLLLPTGTRAVEAFGVEPEIAADWRGCGTVLLVDDEETVIDIGSEMLRELGFEVLIAWDGAEALEVFGRNSDRISYVILDLTMPHMDGEQAFRELRRIRPDVRVIMSSGYNEQEVTQRFSGKGLAGFIQKPYKLATLRDTIMAAGAADTNDQQ